MKKFLFILFLMTLFVIYAGPGTELFSKLLRLDEPEVHEIQTGDWLSKLAEKYYGDASYWEELALVNRAPDGDLIFPGEEVVVPSFEAIQEIRRSRSISAVNKVLSEQQNILAGKITHPVPENATPVVEEPVQSPGIAEDNSIEGDFEPIPQDESAFQPENESEEVSTGSGPESLLKSTPFVTGIAVLGVVVAIAIFIFARRKKREEELETYNESPQEERSLFTFNDFHRDDGEDNKEDHNGNPDKDEDREEKKRDSKKEMEIA